MNRRDFLALGVGTVVAAAASGNETSTPESELWDPDRPPLVTGKPLRVQPVFMHTTFERREATSWRSWSRINSDQPAAEEIERIGKELAALTAQTEFPLQILPLAKVTSAEQAANIHAAGYDALLLYPATGRGDMLRACFPKAAEKDVIIFVRHQSGPLYYWYEGLSTRYLKIGTREEVSRNSATNHGGPTVHDVVVDEYGEVLWRLRALYGLKNFVGARIVALGGPLGKYDADAPKVARDRYKLEIVDVGYDELTRRIDSARNDPQAVARAEKRTERYLAQPGTTLATEKRFVVNAFLMYGIIKQWLREHNAPAFTIAGCMGQALPIVQTTPCMPLSWLNDEGHLAFCESDFVVIPAGILLHYVSGKPVFLHNSTFPHKALVTCAHCTAPRRMDGKRYEPARIVTHYESDFGAAPKVDMAVSQEVTFIDPEYSTPRWVGFKGVIRANPSYEICRTQQDVEILGDWRKLLGEVRDSHWMMAYGDYLSELRYAASKIGLDWVELAG